jgi:hypothetical protein
MVHLLQGIGFGLIGIIGVSRLKQWQPNLTGTDLPLDEIERGISIFLKIHECTKLTAAATRFLVDIM